MNIFEQQMNEFVKRHVGPDEAETAQMLQTVGLRSMDELVEKPSRLPSGCKSRCRQTNPSANGNI